MRVFADRGAAAMGTQDGDPVIGKYICRVGCRSVFVVREISETGYLVAKG
jgi:hypothetical protein